MMCSLPQANENKIGIKVIDKWFSLYQGKLHGTPVALGNEVFRVVWIENRGARVQVSQSRLNTLN